MSYLKSGSAYSFLPRRAAAADCIVRHPYCMTKGRISIRELIAATLFSTERAKVKKWPASQRGSACIGRADCHCHGRERDRGQEDVYTVSVQQAAAAARGDITHEDNAAAAVRGFIIVMEGGGREGPYNLTLHRLRTTIGRKKEKEKNGRRGIPLHSRKLLAFSLCGEISASRLLLAILRFHSFFIHCLDPQQENTFHAALSLPPSFIRFPPSPPHVNQCWKGRSRYTILVPPSLPAWPHLYI